MAVRIWLASLDGLDRARPLARRSMARALLARETGIDADELTLERRCLEGPEGELWWSASSSGSMAAIAIAPWRVGLDLERRRKGRGWDRIASRYFNERESREAAGSPTRFLELWTLKEAYLKALGVGLAGGLRALDCTSLEPAGEGWSRSDAHPGWRFGDVDLHPDLIAAVAVEGMPDRIERIEVRSWPEDPPL